MAMHGIMSTTHPLFRNLVSWGGLWYRFSTLVTPREG